jgi:hypothetical protein
MPDIAHDVERPGAPARVKSISGLVLQVQKVA